MLPTIWLQDFDRITDYFAIGSSKPGRLLIRRRSRAAGREGLYEKKNQGGEDCSRVDLKAPENRVPAWRGNHGGGKPVPLETLNINNPEGTEEDNRRGLFQRKGHQFCKSRENGLISLDTKIERGGKWETRPFPRKTVHCTPSLLRRLRY